MLKPNTAAKFILIVFSSLFLISTFQNCAQPIGEEAFTPISSGSDVRMNEPDALEKVDNVDLSSADIIIVSLRSIYSSTNTRPSPNEIQNLQINLSNGEMRPVDSDGIILSTLRLCLLRSELEEFKSVLKNSRLCQPAISAVREDLVCTQEYRYPFAWLKYANGDQVKLGEVSGCNKSLDLCEEHRDVYNGFIAYLRNHLDSRKCL